MPVVYVIPIYISFFWCPARAYIPNTPYTCYYVYTSLYIYIHPVHTVFTYHLPPSFIHPTTTTTTKTRSYTRGPSPAASPPIPIYIYMCVLTCDLPTRPRRHRIIYIRSTRPRTSGSLITGESRDGFGARTREGACEEPSDDRRPR